MINTHENTAAVSTLRLLPSHVMMEGGGTKTTVGVIKHGNRTQAHNMIPHSQAFSLSEEK